MRAGRLRDRVTFQEPVRVSNGAGGNTKTWSDVVTVWGAYSPERGREQLAGGAIQATGRGVLQIRYSSTVAVITEEHRALINGETYNILSVTNPDRRNRALELVLERGTAS